MKIKYFEDKEALSFGCVSSFTLVINMKVIYSEGDHPRELYFISSGRCSLVYKSYVFKTIVERSYFGDIDILLGVQRLNTCIASVQKEVELLTLDCESLKEILNEYPSIENEMRKIAEIKIENN